MRTTIFFFLAAAAIATVAAACASKSSGASGAAQVCSTGGGASLCVAKATFDVSEAIDVQFAGGPGKPKDWVAVYPAGACDPTCPSPSTLWEYCATHSHTSTGATVTSGSVTIDANGNASNWPLPPGKWDMVYLVDDGYSPIAKVSFTVAGDAPGGTSGTSSGGSTCTNVGSCGPSSDNCKCGLSCVHVGEGRYKCGQSCTTAQDCASSTDPTTGKPWSSCVPPHTGPLDITYEGYCQ